MELPGSEVRELLKTIHLFNALSDSQLDRVIEQLESYTYAEGQSVYQTGDSADSLFIIFSGSVELSYELPEGREIYGLLIARDYFGEEALTVGGERIMDAESRSQTTLLRLSAQALVDLAEEIPPLAERLDLIERSFNLLQQVNLDWLGEGEVVHLITRRHSLFLLIKLALPGLLLLGGGLPLAYSWLFTSETPTITFLLLAMVLTAAAGWAVWSLVDWSNDYTLLTNRRILNTQKLVLLYENRQEVPLDAVLSHDLRRDQWGRWLNYGSIFVRTYTGTVELRLVPSPELIVNMIQRQRERIRIIQEEEYRKKVRKTLRQRLGSPSPLPDAPRQQGEPARPKETYEPGHLQYALASLFRLRFEAGGMVTYWTHWWMLLRRIWAPSLTLLIVIAIVILSLAGIFPLEWSTAFWLAMIAGLLVGGWWLYDFVDWRNDRYIITQEQLVDLYQKPLGSEQRRTAPLRNIQTIEYERRGIIGLLLNFGTVFIRIGDTEFTFNNVFNPSEVQRELFQRLVEYNQRERKRDQERTERQIGEWIEDYHELFGGNNPPPDSLYSDRGFG